jgi:hypothetical protein
MTSELERKRTMLINELRALEPEYQRVFVEREVGDAEEMDRLRRKMDSIVANIREIEMANLLEVYIYITGMPQEPSERMAREEAARVKDELLRGFNSVFAGLMGR